MKTMLTRFVIPCLLCLAILSACHAAEDDFTFQRLRDVINGKQPSEVKIGLLIVMLKKELAQPSPEIPAIQGGLLNTSRFQGVLVAAIGTVGSDNPTYVRQLRDAAADPLLRDRLTVALAHTGETDTIPDLLRIARTDPQRDVISMAIYNLPRLLRASRGNEPPGIFPAGARQPLSPAVEQQALDLLFESLKNPAKVYRDEAKEERLANYPLQEEAANALRLLGYRVEPVPEGWRVWKGAEVERVVRFDRGESRMPREYPESLNR